MSRALTVFNRRDRDARENKDDLEKIRGHAGCSEPVARNLLKYAKFGIGPLSGKEPAALPTEAERVALAAPLIQPIDKKEKLKQMEKKLKEQQKAEQEAKPTSANPFEDADLQPVKKRMKPQIGKISIGTVEKKPEEDPKAPPLPAEPEDDDDDLFVAPRIAIREFREKPLAPTAPPPKQQPEQRKPGKKKKKRKNAKGDTDDSSSDSETRKKPNAAGAAPAAGAGAKSSGSGLMTEAEVMAMMRPEKKPGVKPQRGSLAAKLRIQKEQQEWESRKADNEEFWKAPKFALCYSAETKRMRGN